MFLVGLWNQYPSLKVGPPPKQMFRICAAAKQAVQTELFVMNLDF